MLSHCSPGHFDLHRIAEIRKRSQPGTVNAFENSQNCVWIFNTGIVILQIDDDVLLRSIVRYFFQGLGSARHKVAGFWRIDVNTDAGGVQDGGGVHPSCPGFLCNFLLLSRSAGVNIDVIGNVDHLEFCFIESFAQAMNMRRFYRFDVNTQGSMP